MERLGIQQPSREATPNQNILRASTAHAVASILEEVALEKLYHDTTIKSVQTPGRAHRAVTYGAKYAEFTPELTMDR